MKTEFINLTPHDINYLGETPITIPPQAPAARCEVERKQVGILGGIPINATTFGEVQGLPAPKPGTYYIVSAIVAQACPERADLLIPDETVYDIVDGQKVVRGCRALATLNGDAIMEQDTIGEPLALASHNDTAQDKALAAAIMEQARQVGADLLTLDAKGTPLADVAADHRQTITKLPEGFSVESPTHCVSRGYNGKRPIYLVLGDTHYVLALGTYFGRESQFTLATSVHDVVGMAERMLDKATISRVLAASKAS